MTDNLPMQVTRSPLADAVSGPSMEEVDPEVYHLIEQEMDREKTKLELIASENFVSRAVLQAAGSVLTNK